MNSSRKSVSGLSLCLKRQFSSSSILCNYAIHSRTADFFKLRISSSRQCTAGNFHSDAAQVSSFHSVPRYYTTQHKVKDNIYSSQREHVVKDAKSYETHLLDLFQHWKTAEPLHNAEFERDLDRDVPDELNNAFLLTDVNELDVKHEMKEHVKELYNQHLFSLLYSIMDRINASSNCMLRVKEAFSEGVSECLAGDKDMDKPDHADLLFETCMLHAHIGDAERAMKIFDTYLSDVHGNSTFSKSRMRRFVELLHHSLPHNTRDKLVEKYEKKYEL